MYQIPELKKYPKLFHAFSTKEDGNMANSILGNLSDFKKVMATRERFLSKIGVDINQCVCMWVTHGCEVIEVSEKSVGLSMRNYEKALKVDGLLTNKRGIYLFLLIADCLPIILYDPLKEAIGLIHAGWKGTDLNVSKKAVERMINLYRTNPKDLVVGFGPAARKDSYKKEDPSQKSDPKWSGFIEPIGSNKYKVDFVGLCKKQLIDVGVLEKNIFDSKIDTVKDKCFFSHTRERNLPLRKQGRFACVIGLL